MRARCGQPEEARLAFVEALKGYDSLIARNPEDVPSRVNAAYPRWRLGSLDPANGADHLRAALAILEPLAAADWLDAKRLAWIPQIEAELAALEKGA